MIGWYFSLTTIGSYHLGFNGRQWEPSSCFMLSFMKDCGNPHPSSCWVSYHLKGKWTYPIVHMVIYRPNLLDIAHHSLIMTIIKATSQSSSWKSSDTSKLCCTCTLYNVFYIKSFYYAPPPHTHPKVGDIVDSLCPSDCPSFLLCCWK